MSRAHTRARRAPYHHLQQHLRSVNLPPILFSRILISGIDPNQWSVAGVVSIQNINKPTYDLICRASSAASPAEPHLRSLTRRTSPTESHPDCEIPSRDPKIFPFPCLPSNLSQLGPARRPCQIRRTQETRARRAGSGLTNGGQLRSGVRNQESPLQAASFPLLYLQRSGEKYHTQWPPAHHHETCQQCKKYASLMKKYIVNKIISKVF